MLYAKWRACERLKILPPGVKPSWDDNDVWTQCLILEYCQGRDVEDFERDESMLKAMVPHALC